MVCTADDFDEHTYLQIKETNSDNVLTRSSSGDPIFQPNELKDSQFWYLLQNLDGEYGFGDFGFIGSKQYHIQSRMLTIGIYCTIRTRPSVAC